MLLAPCEQSGTNCALQMAHRPVGYANKLDYPGLEAVLNAMGFIFKHSMGQLWTTRLVKSSMAGWKSKEKTTWNHLEALTWQVRNSGEISWIGIEHCAASSLKLFWFGYFPVTSPTKKCRGSKIGYEMVWICGFPLNNLGDTKTHFSLNHITKMGDVSLPSKSDCQRNNYFGWNRKRADP